ncbi:hypothetical protein OH799_07225 [Nocardia sp. NBC_00881]|uniref:PEP/pyruvate-binding domain-containing protein n=1 Tax=Nocardia sp. NBC_00881 TaxID=2975995 RepID=UPI00386A3880|nr:hypothetical protein OH799_07225 [Nocardia sp. NBC_00881]
MDTAEPAEQPINTAAQDVERAGEVVRDLSAIRLSDEVEAGGKGANLGELTAAGLPVPSGFVILRDGYLDAMRRGGVAPELAAEHRRALAAIGDDEALARHCEQLRALVAKAGMPPDLADRITLAYQRLGTDTAEAVVAVRSSATGEDSASASFAGMNATFTNISGPAALLDAVQRCWTSLFSPRAETYRAERSFTGEPAIRKRDGLRSGAFPAVRQMVGLLAVLFPTAEPAAVHEMGPIGT